MRTLRTGCSKSRAKNFCPATHPLPRGVGRPKCNQLEMVITVQTQFGEDLCTQFRVIVVTDPQTDRGDYTTLCRV